MGKTLFLAWDLFQWTLFMMDTGKQALCKCGSRIFCQVGGGGGGVQALLPESALTTFILVLNLTVLQWFINGLIQRKL